jgi:hypothetical protein
MRRRNTMNNTKDMDTTQTDNMANGEGVIQQSSETVKRKSKITFNKMLLALGLVAVIAIAIAICFQANKNNEPVEERTVTSTISINEILETFELSSLDIEYSDIITDSVERERKLFYLISGILENATQVYAVQYDGSAKLGINGKEIETIPSPNGDGEDLTILIPEAYIISHDAPKTGSLKVIYNDADHMDDASIEQFAGDFNEQKAAKEEEFVAKGYLDQAREGARKQIETFVKAIPGINDQYKNIEVKFK